MSQVKILVFDFGSQYSTLVCRRLREAGVYSVLVRYDAKVDWDGVAGVVLSGGPASRASSDAPHLDDGTWAHIEKHEIPVLGICYGMHEIATRAGGLVEAVSTNREYGLAFLRGTTGDDLLTGVDEDQIWMSHGDSVTRLPEGFVVLGSTAHCPVVVIRGPKNVYGVQFHPEVSHTKSGVQLLRNFAWTVCGIDESWNMKDYRSWILENIRDTVKDSMVVGAVSGGVDSTVCAALLHAAIGDKFRAVVIDTGMMRHEEVPEVEKRLMHDIPGLLLRTVDASSRFLERLKDVTDPEKKRVIIGDQFIREFKTVVDELGLKAKETFLLQGTLYSDVIESGMASTASNVIKSHHNVGGLPKDLDMRLLEPLRCLFKDEVRQLGSELGLNKVSLNRHPFPGPGLAIRIIGSITSERLRILRSAEAILSETIIEANVYADTQQAFVVLLPEVMSVGVQGDARKYGMTCVIRAVTTSDFMTASWQALPVSVVDKASARIVAEVEEITRVCLDVTSKPPGTVEWE